MTVSARIPMSTRVQISNASRSKYAGQFGEVVNWGYSYNGGHQYWYQVRIVNPTTSVNTVKIAGSMLKKVPANKNPKSKKATLPTKVWMVIKVCPDGTCFVVKNTNSDLGTSTGMTESQAGLLALKLSEQSPQNQYLVMKEHGRASIVPVTTYKAKLV